MPDGLILKVMENMIAMGCISAEKWISFIVMDEPGSTVSLSALTYLI